MDVFRLRIIIGLLLLLLYYYSLSLSDERRGNIALFVEFHHREKMQFRVAEKKRTILGKM